MEVILRKDVETLGTTGQVVKVAPGYARNFLVPRGLAVPATESNKKIVEQQRQSYLRKESKLASDATELAKLMANVSINISQKAGENDQLFGSVTAQDIADQLDKQGYKIDRKKIALDHPIRSIGSHKVAVKLHREVTIEIPVNVTKEEE
jgi:large subunit ribosomal protein L9